MRSSLGEEWFKTYYPRIKRSLGYDQHRDEMSRDLLLRILSQKKIKPPGTLAPYVRGNVTVMFGAGPSLESDLAGLKDFVTRKEPLVVAADGAADALYEAKIVPSIVVSDLDSCSETNLEKNSHEGFLFAHAHGDNSDLVEKIVPSLGPNLCGTTQVSSVERVVNYGGLTDGDRACFILSHFQPSQIIIAGMDFGSQEGRYSKNRYDLRAFNREQKLDWGKQSLEFLIRKRPKISFYNVTELGSEIIGARRTNYAALT